MPSSTFSFTFVGLLLAKFSNSSVMTSLTKIFTFALIDDVFVFLGDLIAFKLGVLENFREDGGFDVSELRCGVFVAK